MSCVGGTRDTESGDDIHDPDPPRGSSAPDSVGGSDTRITDSGPHAEPRTLDPRPRLEAQTPAPGLEPSREPGESRPRGSRPEPMDPGPETQVSVSSRSNPLRGVPPATPLEPQGRPLRRRGPRGG